MRAMTAERPSTRWAAAGLMTLLVAPGVAIGAVDETLQREVERRLSKEDAIKSIKYGADALWISNHGGRMLNSGISGIDALQAIKKIKKFKKIKKNFKILKKIKKN